jgi:hypothetical protein
LIGGGTERPSRTCVGGDLSDSNVQQEFFSSLQPEFRSRD